MLARLLELPAGARALILLAWTVVTVPIGGWLGGVIALEFAGVDSSRAFDEGASAAGNDSLAPTVGAAVGLAAEGWNFGVQLVGILSGAFAGLASAVWLGIVLLIARPVRASSRNDEATPVDRPSA